MVTAVAGHIAHQHTVPQWHSQLQTPWKRVVAVALALSLVVGGAVAMAITLVTTWNMTSGVMLAVMVLFTYVGTMSAITDWQVRRVHRATLEAGTIVMFTLGVVSIQSWTYVGVSALVILVAELLASYFRGDALCIGFVAQSAIAAFGVHSVPFIVVTIGVALCISGAVAGLTTRHSSKIPVASIVLPGAFVVMVALCINDIV